MRILRWLKSHLIMVLNKILRRKKVEDIGRLSEFEMMKIVDNLHIKTQKNMSDSIRDAFLYGNKNVDK